jgi:hypothetical protein
MKIIFYIIRREKYHSRFVESLTINTNNQALILAGH